MSEYQYYEFAAVDFPLTRAQMSRLRSLSSRARITPRRFTNTYNWGDFKGNPDKLMEEFFDAHLYTSNFGYRKLCLRVPASALSLATVENYLVEDCLEAWESRGNLILKFALNSDDGGWDDDYDWDDNNRERGYYENDDYDSDNYDDDDSDDDDDDCNDDDYTDNNDDDDDDEDGSDRETPPPSSLDALLALRDEIARGDLRALYLGWLGAVQSGHLDDEATEPPVPPGLGKLTSEQKTLAQFLHISTDLIEAAAENSAPLTSLPQSTQLARERENLCTWLAALPIVQKDTWLARLASPATATADDNSATAANTEFSPGENARKNPDASRNDPMTIATEARRDFLNFLEAQRKAKSSVPESASARAQSDSDAASRRTVQALLRRAEEIETAREQRAAEAAARAAEERARKAADAREKHLDRQAAREHELWPAVHKHIATRLPKEYDAAIALLLDLRDLARRRGKDAHAAFVTQLCDLKDTWKSRHGLIKRIDAAFAKPATHSTQQSPPMQ